MENLAQNALNLLTELIKTPSLSGSEEATAQLIKEFLERHGIPFQSIKNNIWAKNKNFNSDKPTILLNSHHDTVKANLSYTRNPHWPETVDGKLYGLGSNDAGGALVSLLATFIHYYDAENLNYNLIFAASAEEENSGKNGMELLLTALPEISFAIVGEPTQMNLAVAEKGLMVLDCIATGVAGHAARDEGQNAIYNALEDINWFKDFQFPKISETLGPIKMSVTLISAGMQHNVVPDECKFVVDVRATDAYTLNETVEIIKHNVKCAVNPRSVRLQPSKIDINHPIVLKGKQMGMKSYGSPTLSDQALMPFNSVKIGPGDSARSHIADEFIYLNEIYEGIEKYIELLSGIL